MINPNELRVFNKVIYKGRIVTIYAVSCHYNGLRKLVITDSQVDIDNGYWIRCQEIDPLPLIPEWLESFGFVKDEHSLNGYTKGAYAIILGSGGVENAFCLLNTGILATCQYLHQLQNLYFALTGEEVAIKETV